MDASDSNPSLDRIPRSTRFTGYHIGLNNRVQRVSEADIQIYIYVRIHRKKKFLIPIGIFDEREVEEEETREDRME